MDEPRPWTRADLEGNPGNRPDGPDGRGVTQDEEIEARAPDDDRSESSSAGGASAPPETVPIDMRDDDDFVCPRCDTEIQLKRLGDRDRIGQVRLFRCVCGEEMLFEHPRGEEAMGVPMQ